jgi:transposase-like protein
MTAWLFWALGISVLAAVGVVLLRVACSHRHATLLPPVHGAGSDRDHARWYCDRCGKTWAAKFEPETRPRLIYGGYDFRKAQRSAARADHLEKERRRLAVKRAGWAQTPAAHGASAGRSGQRTAEVVPLRRVGE